MIFYGTQYNENHQLLKNIDSFVSHLLWLYIFIFSAHIRSMMNITNMNVLRHVMCGNWLCRSIGLLYCFEPQVSCARWRVRGFSHSLGSITFHLNFFFVQYLDTVYLSTPVLHNWAPQCWMIVSRAICFFFLMKTNYSIILDCQSIIQYCIKSI